MLATQRQNASFKYLLALHNLEYPDLSTQSMYFSQNHANIAGSTLYGGLLDRRAVSPFAEVHNKYSRDFRGDGIAYFKNVSIFEHYYDHCDYNNYYNYDYNNFYDYYNIMTTILRTVQTSHLIQFECAFASMLTKAMTASTNTTLRLKRDKRSHSQLLLLIRMANQLVQPSKPPSTSLRVV